MARVNVLDNDSDADTATNALTVRVESEPANGTLTLNPDGTFRYAHDGSETSSDSFTYIVNDGALDSNTATVTITVTAENDAPLAVDDAITVAEGGTATALTDGALSVRDNDSDAETATNALTVRVDTGPANGALTLNTDGTFSYVHDGGETSSDSFTYIANDGALDSAPATVTITVTPENDAPVAVDDDVETNEDTAVVFDVHTNDTDADGDTLFVAAINGTTVIAGDGQAIAVTDGGTLTLNADGRLNFNPNGEFEDLAPDESSEVTATYQITDGRGGTDEGMVTIRVTGENDAPVAVADAFTVAEGGTATTLVDGTTTSVLNNDSDVDTAAGSLRVRVDSGPANGMLTLNENGIFSYAHNGSETSSDSFTYIVNDGALDSNTATVTITVTPVNDAPLALGDAITVAEGGTATTLTGGITTSVTANDSDAETPADELTVRVATEPANGRLTLNPDGTFSYTHNGGETSSDSFTYIVNDGADDSTPATVTITVTPVNDAPVAVADEITVAEGGTATALADGAPSVRDNDSDAETATNALTVRVESEPANGALTLNTDGTFSYVHNGGETSSDSFTYIANDGALDSAPATVTITVTGENDAPVAVDDTFETDEDTVVMFDVRSNDTDADNDTLSVVALNGTAVMAGDGQAIAVTDGGTLTLNADGGLSFNPRGAFDDLAPDGSRSVTATYQITDGRGGTDEGMVTIRVTGENDAPVAVADAFTVAEGGTATTLADGTTTSVLNNDSDVDTAAGSLTVMVDSGPANGTLTLNTDGTFTYTHNGSETSSDSFTYIVNDGADDSTPATVTITVTPVNDAPVAMDDAITVAEGGTATTLTGGALSVRDNDSDAETATGELTVRVGTGPAHGTLDLNEDGTFSYVHDGGETSSDSFTYIANDGALDSAPATVTITVTPEDDPPVFDLSTYAFGLPENQNGSSTPVAVGTVSATDPDVSDTPVYAIAEGDMTRFRIDVVSGAIGYIGAGEDFEAQGGPPVYVLMVTATAGGVPVTTTVTITVTNVDESPVFNPDTYRFELAENLNGSTSVVAFAAVTATDPDDGDTPTYAITAGDRNLFSINGASGIIRYIGTGENFEALPLSYALTITATANGQNDTASVTVTVTNVNEPPEFVGDPYAFTLAENRDGSATEVAFDAVTATDPENAPIVYSITAGGMSLFDIDGASGVIRYTGSGEDFEETGGPPIYNLTITATAGGVPPTATAVVTVTVTDANDPPLAVDDDADTTEDEVVAIDVLDNDMDVDAANDPLTVTAINGTAVNDDQAVAVSGGGTLSRNAGGNLNFNPVSAFDDLAPTENREVMATYQISDGRGGTAEAQVTITVTGVNDAPTADAGPPQTVAEGVTVTLDGTRSSDPENGVLNYQWSRASGPAVTLSNATIAQPTFTAPTGLSEAVSFVFQLIVTDDQNTASEPDMVTITVTGEDDIPVFTGAPYAFTLAENQDGRTVAVAVGTVTATDADETDTPSYAIAEGDPQSKFAIDSTSGAIGYIGAGEDFEAQGGPPVYNLIVTATAGGVSVPTAVTVTVTDANDPPVAVDDDADANEDTAMAIDVLANDTDVDAANDPLSVVAINGTAVTAGDGQAIDVTGGGTLTLTADGRLSFDPNGEFEDLASTEDRSVTATYQITDGSATAGGTLTITVTGLNDPAVISGLLGEVTEDADENTAAGMLVVNDVDGENGFVRAASIVLTPDGDYQGIYGTLAFALAPAGDWTYTLDNADPQTDALAANVRVMDTFEVMALDGTPATVVITVIGANDPPQAVADEIMVAEGGTAATLADGTTTSVLNNDSDVDTAAGSLRVRVDSGPANGMLTLNENGTFSYAHNGSETSSDSFTYIVNDGADDSTPASVTITVTPVNDAPVALGDAITVAEGGTATTLTDGTTMSVLDNDSDADTAAGSLTVMVDSGPANGTLTLNPDGTFMYVHDGSETSGDSFTYIANDGADDSAPATVMITVTPVNDAPLAVADEITVAEGGTATALTGGALNVLDNDSDADTAAGLLRVMVDNEPVNGTLTLDPDGTFMYVHDGSETSSDSFTYIVNDGALDSAPATVTITVTPEDDPPVFDLPTYAFGLAENQNGSSTPVAVGTVSATDPDVSDTPVYAIAEGDMTRFRIDVVSGAIGYIGTGEDFEAPDGPPVYVLMVTATAGSLAATAPVTVTVTDANDPPVAVDDDADTTEDAMVAIDVLDNDMDVDAANDPLTVTAINGTTVNDGQAVAVSGGGTLSRNAGGNLSFNPNGAFENLAMGGSRSVTATYQISDGRGGTAEAQVTITVRGINDAPTADAGEPQTVDEGVTVTLDGTASTDPENGVLTYQWSRTSGPLVTLSDATAQPTFTAPTGLTEAVSFGFQLVVTDDQNTASEPDTVTITVTGMNDPPVFDSPTYAFDLPENEDGSSTPVDVGTVIATDADATDTPVYAIAAGDPQGKFEINSASGAIAYTGTGEDFEAQDGPPVYELSVTATAGGDTATAAVTVTVTNVDEPPVFDPDTYEFDLAENRDGGASVVAFDAVTATDPEGDEIVYSITTGGAGLFNIDGTSGVIRYTGAGEDFEAPGGAPSYNLTITATAGTFAATAPVTVSVTNVDEPPVFDPASYEFELVENRDGSTTAIEFSAVTATDPENVPIVYSITAGGMSLFDIDGASGVIRYTGSGEDFEETGGPPIYNLTITATAGGAPATATAPVTVTVTDANDPPLAVDDDADTTEDAMVAIDVLANDMDVDAANDTLTVVAINGTTVNDGQAVAVTDGGTLSRNAGGNLSFNPNGAFETLAMGGSRSVTATYQISDGRGGTAEAQVTITVTGVNDAPTADAGPPQTVAEGVTVTLDGTASTDPENGALRYEWSRTSGPLVTLSDATAQPTFTAPTGLTEAVSFGFRLVVTDDQNTPSPPDTVTITVSAAAVIGGELSGTVVEDAAQNQATGTLAIINPDGADETFVAQDDPTPGTYGTFTLAATGAWTYTLDNSRDATNRLSAGRDGMEAFPVAASAPGIPGAMVRIMITGVNDVPVAVADVLATDEDTPAPIAVLANDTDPEDDALSVAAINDAPADIGVPVALPGGGTLTRNADGRLDFDPRPLGAFDDLQVGAERIVMVAYQITDGEHTADGTLTITVTGVNDPPAFINAPYTFTLAENQPGDGGTPVAVGAVAADDPDTGDTLTYAITTTTPLFGIDPASGAITYTGPGEDLETQPSHTLMVRVTDGADATDTATVTINIGNEDEPPEFDPATYAFNLEENRDGTPPVVLGTVTATDPEGDAITYTITTGDAGLFGIDGTSGEISYTGSGEDFETAPPTYALTITATAGGLDAIASVTVTVINVNEPPVFDPASYEFELVENRDGGASVVAFDAVMATDPEDDEIVYSITTGGAGLFNIDGTSGVIRYIGSGEDFEMQPLTYDLTITATAGGDTATAAVTVTVTDANDPPMAVADAISTNEDTAVTIDVLANDTDQENDTLSVIAINGVTVMNVGDMVDVTGSGTLTLIVGGDLNFNPVGAFDDLRPGQNRPVTATYRIMDDQNAIADGDITITVTGVNDPPVFINTPYVFTLAENQPGTTTPVMVGTVSADDPDADDTLAYAITTTTTLFSIDPASGAITYTGPGEDLETLPSHTLMVRVTDGADATDTTTVTINIGNEDEPPEFDPDTYAFNLAENEDGSSTPVDVGMVTATDPDVSDTPVYMITAGDTTRFLVDETSGVISYIGTGEDFETPPPTYDLTIIATANGQNDTASVTVTVTNVDEPPVFDPASYAFTIAENRDGSTTAIVLDAVTATDPDDGDTPTYAITTGDMTRFRIDGTSGAISYTGTGEDFEAQGGPPAYDLTITATAGGQSATAPVTVTVTAVNEAPVAVADEITVAEGGTATTLTGGASSVRDNDSDADTATGSLTVTLMATPANGMLTLNPDGTFSYAHDGSETSGDSFTYIVNDGATDSNVATVTITVTPVNDAPMAVGDAITVTEGGTATTLTGGAPNVLDNDSDADTATGSLTVRVDTAPANGTLTLNPAGTFSYAHDGSETSSDSFTYIVHDGTDDSAPATVRITVMAANDAPVAVDDALTVAEGGTGTILSSGASSVRDNDRDAETATGSLTVRVGAAPARGTLRLNADGTFTYTHDGSETSGDSFTYIVNDGALDSNTATVTITVTADNDAPTAEAGQPQTVAEGATVTLDGSASSDPESDALTFAWTQLSGEPVTLDNTAAARPTFTAPPELLTNMTLEFRLIVADPQGAASAPDTVTITVTAGINDAPTAHAGPDQTVAEPDGAVVTVTLDGSASTDPEGETLLYQWSQASGPGVTLAGMNTVRPVFAVPQQLTESMDLVFSLTVRDAQSTSAPDTVTITVTADDDSPVAADDRFMTTKGGTATLLVGGAASVLDNDRDADTARSGLTASMMTLPQYGTLSLQGDGTFTYVHDGSEERRDRFTYRVSDGNTNSNIATVMVAVQTSEELRSRALKGWLARFGRTVASNAEEGISERLSGVLPDGTSYAVVGGHRLSFGTVAGQPGQDGGLPERDGGSPERDGGSRAMSARELLSLSSFQFKLNESDPGDPGLVLWGRGAVSRFDGRESNLLLDGEVSSGTMGIEHVGENERFGVAVTHSEGRGGWKFDGATIGEGEMKAALTSVYPYLRWSPLEGLDAWALLGYGRGDVQVRDNVGGETLVAPIAMEMAAGGTRCELLPWRNFERGVKTDFFVMNIESDPVAGLEQVRANVQRVRMSVEGAYAPVLASGNRSRTALELGVRHDSGDAESGFGMDMGVLLKYANLRSGVDVVARGRYLVAHRDEDFKEWSTSLGLRLDPGYPGRGVALTLEPVWDESGSSQRVELDFSHALGRSQWMMTRELRLELYGERRLQGKEPSGYRVGLSGELRF